MKKDKKVVKAVPLPEPEKPLRPFPFAMPSEQDLAKFAGVIKDAVKAVADGVAAVENKCDADSDKTVADARNNMNFAILKFQADSISDPVARTGFYRRLAANVATNGGLSPETFGELVRASI